VVNEPPDLRPELRAFLYSCVDSIEQAEILLRLLQSNESSTARTIGRALGMTDAIARHHLETLVARGLLQTAVTEDVHYRFGPRTPELQRLSALFADAWSASRSAVLQFIAAQPRGSLKSFSKAFRLRKEE
jgi:hypothetical protein